MAWQIVNIYSEIHSFYSSAQNQLSGCCVRVGAVDLNNDGKADILTAAGPGGGPNVTAFDISTLTQLDTFFAYDQAFTGGGFVAGGGGPYLKRPIS